MTFMHKTSLINTLQLSFTSYVKMTEWKLVMHAKIHDLNRLRTILC